MNARVRLVLVSTLIVVGILVLVGATYQGVATALERRSYPHPGRLVDVGGHQLHIFCIGEGRQPTVILEAPEGRMSAVWAWVQPAVAAKQRRVCSYDRAGLGWSERGDGPFIAGRVPEELYALLRNTQTSGPYVLAGQSLGAFFVQAFVGRYPDEVSGIVLIDAPSAPGAPDQAFFTAAPWLARVGLLRAARTLSSEADGLPPRDAGALAAFFNRPDHLTRAAGEMAQWDEAVRLGAAARIPDHVGIRRVDIGRGGLSNPHQARRVTEAILQFEFARLESASR